MKQLLILLFAFLHVYEINAQNVGVGTMNPSTELDVNGGIKTKYSGQMIANILSTGIQTVHLPIAPVPIGWDLTNTIVIVNNVDGGSGVIHQAKLESNSSIALIYTPDLVGLVRFSYIVFLYGAPITYPFPVTYICNQLWMTKNLDVSKYRNGDPIPQVTDLTVWANLTIGAWCWYNNDSATYASTYGKLYNWYAVNDSRGLAPFGWHIHSDAEWSTLSTCLGGDIVAGGKMKETGSIHWNSPNSGATNSSGFAGLPGGTRNGSGTFYNLGYYGNFWSSTESNTNNAWGRSLDYNDSGLYRGGYNKIYGWSVRCLRD